MSRDETPPSQPEKPEVRFGEERCWRAVLERDDSLDGEIFFGVVTTGVFCRPSCPARRPLRKNVRFFETAEAAAGAGLRACKRCRPLERSRDDRTATIRGLCDFIRERCDSGEPLTLDVLAEHSGLTPSQLRRSFRQVVGVTPRQFVEASRFEKLKAGLQDGEEVTRAIYDAGFSSSSRVYQQAGSRLGMTPSQYRAGGAGVEMSWATAETPFGLLVVAATDRGLAFIGLGDDRDELREELRREFPAATLVEAAASPQLGEWLAALRRHLEGDLPDLDLPLDVRATAFQQQVWSFLQSIPYGETRTYTEVAEALGQPRSARAVGTACASNPVSILVPCHRVLRRDGGLGGYRWGLDRKRALIEGEKTNRR